MPADGEAGRTLGELLAAGVQWLRRRGVAEAESLCQWLAAHQLGIPRLELTLQSTRRLKLEEVERLRRGVVRLGSDEPLQYVLGEWDFRGLSLTVDRRALIPRPETEQLVELVLRQEEVWRQPRPRIIDVGTGSGCIVVSLAHEAPAGEYLASDISGEALSLARENAMRVGVAERIEFIECESCALVPAATLDVVVSNPPYIASEVCRQLPRRLREHEPWLALDGGDDGLVVIRQVVNDAALRLKAGGWCFLEIGAGQGRDVCALMRRAGFAMAEVRRDLAGRERHVVARM